MAFQVPYIYDYILKFCRQQAVAIQNHENTNIRDIGKSETQRIKYKTLNFGRSQAYDRSYD
jgi:hypothetical protein